MYSYTSVHSAACLEAFQTRWEIFSCHLTVTLLFSHPPPPPLIFIHFLAQVQGRGGGGRGGGSRPGLRAARSEDFLNRSADARAHSRWENKTWHCPLYAAKPSGMFRFFPRKIFACFECLVKSRKENEQWKKKTFSSNFQVKRIFFFFKLSRWKKRKSLR